MSFRAELRRQRYVLFSRRMWTRRIVFLLGAIAVALASVAFAISADRASALYTSWSGAWPLWTRLLITPLAFVVCAGLIRRYFPNAQGSGIPQAIAARRVGDLAFSKTMLGWRVAVGKVALTLVALAAGASVGREGPTVQIGASIMLYTAGLAGIGRQSGLVLAGSAAGIAAAFNTPLAGVVFAIEEMAKAFDRRINPLIITAVIVAGIVTIAILGDYQYFGTVSSHLPTPVQWLAIPVCALVGGALGGVFARLTILFTTARTGFVGALKRRPLIFAAGCGLLVALLSIATNDYAAGTGYEHTRALFAGEAVYPWWYPFAKLVATVASSVAGIAGGLFSPSLAVGAGLGSLLEPFSFGLSLPTLSLLAMVAYFAGVVQSPLTAFVIVLEMTDDNRMLVPLMTTALMAAGVSRLISPEPLYHALSREFDVAPAKSETAVKAPKTPVEA